MKKLIPIVLCLFGVLNFYAQNCVTGSVTLQSQAAVNAFVATHSGTGCISIPLSLIIQGGDGTANDITDISGLSFLQILVRISS
jgi:hypothetical protein